MAPEHLPVMREAVLELLQCGPGGVFVDATLGLGGHAWAILEKIQPGGMLIGLDRDEESLEKARLHLQPYSDGTRLLHENFKNLPLVLNNLGIRPIDGILVDLGVSSYQLLLPERGFSFQSEDLLDMRMDRTQRLTAADLVNDLPEEQLADLIYRYGEERFSRRIAAAIAAAREGARITRCSHLAEIVSRAVRSRGARRVHPATRTFQALRIAVNQELEGLEDFFSNILSFLKPGGRLVVISFHSLEDRIVKRSFRMLSGNCVCERPPALCTCPLQERARVITSRPLTPSDAELATNPRARSAKLRALERS
ncbi:MAG: 16S rRNA (cytosine(1402)-N(4))-methyltransferase RsmH [Acidobacteriia bacterium]|nr:16S rRNA (cytosine(1402)-N(4))-methyltransferase RsmH [Terriglobia bacterium]